MSQIISSLIRDVPDFPKQGILFKDITPVLANPEALAASIDWYCEVIEKNGGCDIIAGIESRGFIFGAAIAHQLKRGLVLIRKPGKLPAETEKISYELEYGSDALEIHKDSFTQNSKVALVDDLLATGGTAEAACKLIGQAGGEVVSALFLLELDFLSGRKKLNTSICKGVESLLHF